MLKDIQWIGTEKKEWLDSFITPEFESIFEQIFGDKEAVIHGELLGPKIQSNLYDVSEFKFYAFDIYNKTDNVFWRQEVIEQYANMLGFERTPIVVAGTLDEIAELVRSAPASKVNPGIEMEGIVIRPVKELKNGKNERVIYKVKVEDLLGRKAGRI